MANFLRIEYKSQKEATFVLMRAQEGGSIPIWKMDMPISAVYMLSGSAESFLSLFEAGVLDEWAHVKE